MKKQHSQELLFFNISKRWPNAVKYITQNGILRAYAEGEPYTTLNMWEFEAERCERVERAVGSQKNSFPKCSKCGSQRFLTSHPFAIVNFDVPFVHSARVVVTGFFMPGLILKTNEVRCVICRTVFPLKQVS